jgi:hypothetical protein
VFASIIHMTIIIQKGTLMRTHHLLIAAAAALVAIPVWAQPSATMDPTGSRWLDEQIAAARHSASVEKVSAAPQPAAGLNVASPKDEAAKNAEGSLASHRAQPANTPSAAGAGPAPGVKEQP